MTTRLMRGIRLSLMAALIASACSSASAQQLTRVRASAIPIIAIAPFFAAVELGYFKEEGLEVTRQQDQGGAIGIPGLVAGAYDVAYVNITTALQAIQQGIDLRIIAGSSKSPAQPPDSVAFVGRKADNIRTGKDFEGKTVAITSRNSIQWLFTRAWVKAKGGDPEKVNFREVQVSQMIDAVKNKQVDVAYALDPFLTFSKRDPELGVIDYPYYLVFPGGQSGFWLVTADTAAKRPEIVGKFVRSLVKGGAWVDANLGKEPYLKLVSGYTRLEPALILTMPVAKADIDIDADSLRRMEALMREHNLLSGPIDVAAKVFKPL